MTGSIDALFAATVLFVGGHFLLSSAPLRWPLVGWLGETRFLVLYSASMIVVLAWVILAYRDAPTVLLWDFGHAGRGIPAIVMPFALFFAVCGLTTPSATMAGAREPDEPGRDLTRGIMRITRHPFLTGVALWAVAHLIANGDTASVILFAGMLILAVGGMWHIDRRRERNFGAAWGPILMSTSAVPFAALIAGRTKFDWSGIGVWRVLLTIAIYLALIVGHPLLIGVPAVPGMG